jgi:Leucine-rich repeat (LRR) protein
MLYSCKKITNIDDLNNCQNLKYLNVECNNGILDSVNVLVHCLELKELLLIGIKIKDGDLSPILTLKNLHNLAIANYKYHKPSVDELKIALNL